MRALLSLILLLPSQVLLIPYGSLIMVSLYMTPDVTHLTRYGPTPITCVRIVDGISLFVSSIGHLTTSSFFVPSVSHVSRLSMHLMSVS